MDNKEIFEVSRDEFTGFMREMSPDSYQVVKQDGNNLIKNIHTNQILGEVVLQDDNESIKYYIYELPPASDRIAAKPIHKITLETRDEVQAFFNILNKIKNDRTLS